MTQSDFLRGMIADLKASGETPELDDGLTSLFTHGQCQGQEKALFSYSENILKRVIEFGNEEMEEIKLDDQFFKDLRSDENYSFTENHVSSFKQFHIGCHVPMLHFLAGRDKSGVWIWPEAQPLLNVEKSLSEFYIPEGNDKIQEVLENKDYHSFLGLLGLPYIIEKTREKEIAPESVVTHGVAVTCSQEEKKTDDKLTWNLSLNLTDLNMFAFIMLVSHR